GEAPPVGADEIDLLRLCVEQDAVERIPCTFLCRCEKRLGDELLQQTTRQLELRFAFKVRDRRKLRWFLREDLEVGILAADVRVVVAHVDSEGVIDAFANDVTKLVRLYQRFTRLLDLHLAVG